jgi:hypothetical protein
VQLIDGDFWGNPVFRKWDHGIIRNLYNYGQTSPPEWKFEDWDTPHTLIEEGADDLGTKANIDVLTKQLDKRYYDQYAIPKWEHITCLCAKDPKPMFDIIDKVLAQDFTETTSNKIFQ